MTPELIERARVNLLQKIIDDYNEAISDEFGLRRICIKHGGLELVTERTVLLQRNEAILRAIATKYCDPNWRFAIESNIDQTYVVHILSFRGADL